jgi:hypothetical protein
MVKKVFACIALSCGVSGIGFACEMPSLVMIPPKEQAVGKEAEIASAVTKYRQEMELYTNCVKAELEAAGGDNAPPLTRKVLVTRNNTAVAEVQAVLKAYSENIGPIEPAN